LSVVCALSLFSCSSGEQAKKRVPIRASRAPLGVWNLSYAPVRVAAGDAAQAVSVPPKSTRTFFLPEHSAGARVSVRNEQTGATLFEGPVSPVAPRMIVDERGVTFPKREDRYLGRLTPVRADPGVLKP
jgi:hypothetical protein